MTSNFCYVVGNATGTPNCTLIDFDSLLLGNCWGHPCLPNHLHCYNNGVLRYLNSNGYTCDCPQPFYGDTCNLIQTHMQQDPHLLLGNGGEADFRGENNTYYNLLSTKSIHVNMMTTESTFYMNNRKLLVHGSYMTELHILSKQFRISLETSYIGKTNLIYMEGMCNNTFFKLGSHKNLKCGDTEIITQYASANIITRFWNISLHINYVYNFVSGANKRLDINIYRLQHETSHGIIGQSYSKPKGKNGAIDKYPEIGEFWTSAMAENIIDGTHKDYIEASPFAHHSFYSIFR